MKTSRISAWLLALAMTLTLFPASAQATEEAWLIPVAREYRDFTDTPGTICEAAARICCQTGLMDGVDASHFFPDSGLSHGQIIVISARLHRLLTGGTLEYFEPISLKGPDWWTPYDGYLREQISTLAEDAVYQSMRDTPTASCYRAQFFHLLAAVLAETGTALPELNQVQAVPDCADQEIIQFYRWGVLAGKDEYGTLYGGSALSRGAAAAMLARLIDPAQRLTLSLRQLELCQDLLGIAPETVVMTVSGKEITAEEFMPTLVSTASSYNHSHLGSFALEMSGKTAVDMAVESLCLQVFSETLAEEMGLDAPSADAVYFSGYHGLTANGQAWAAWHDQLYYRQLPQQGSSVADFPEEQIPQAEFADVWNTLDLTDFSQKVAALPYWGGYF